MTDDKKNEPMDKTAREGEVAMHVAQPRNAYALDQIISEVEGLFPGVGYEVSHRNQRGVAFDVQFDLSTITPEDRNDFVILMGLLDDPAYNRDMRIESITTDTEYVLVSFRNDPRTQDSPAPFGLEPAWAVIREMPLSFPGGFDAERDGPSL